MTAIQLLTEISADPWVHGLVWQYHLEQRVGVVALAYAAASFKEGATPPNAAEAAGELRCNAGAGATKGADGGHSAEWWAVQLIREIGWLLCTEHPEGVQATGERWAHFGGRWTRLVEEIDAWEAHHRAIRPAVADGTHRFGTGGRDYSGCDPRPLPTRSEALRQHQRPRAAARHRRSCRWWQAREAARYSGEALPRELPAELRW